MQTIFNINHRPPFKDPVGTLGVQAYDVIKIRNVPFAVTISEIKAFVGRLTSSPLIKDHEQGYPVHIIMERPTGKTMDCFVEFQYHGAAQAAVRRAEQTQFQGKVLKMGTRHVEVEMSSEGELCAALFPRAKSVRWDTETGVPTILVNQDPFSEGFQGFFTIEEITSVCKHATTPQKSTFMQRCQQRVYESMISTLYKFPWHVPQHYSVNTRNFLWSAYMELLHNLIARVQPSSDQSLYGHFDKEVGLSHNLLLEYIFAGLNVQMFSLRQKFMIVHASGPLGPGFRLPRQAIGWPFQTLIPEMNWSSDVVDQWLDVVDTGYQRCAVHGIRHGWEQYLMLNRDESGFLRTELSDAGKALTFHDLISIELGVMSFLVEQGRQQWCLEYGVYYQPLNMWSQPAHDDEVDAVEAPMQSLQLTRHDEYKFDEISNASSDPYGSLVPNSPAEMSDAEDNVACSGSYDLRGATPSVQTSGSGHFNPATPPFVPSQSWSNGSANRARNNLPPANAPTQPRAAGYDLSFALAPSWASPQELPSSRGPSISRITSPMQQQYRGDSTTHRNEYNNSISPEGTRRASVASYRSASRSSAYSDTLVDIADNNSHKRSEYSNSRTGAVPDVSPQPVFGNIWGPAFANTSPATVNSKKGILPLRRSVSAEARGTNRNPQSRFENDIITDAPPNTGIGDFQAPKPASIPSTGVGRPAQILNGGEPGNSLLSTQPTLKLYATGAASLPPKPPPSTGNHNGWAYGSPRHGARSRSSTSRSFVPVQATINEEGDVSATDAGNGVDDAATDTGGVSLQDWN